MPPLEVVNLPSQTVIEEKKEEGNPLPFGASAVSSWNSFNLNKIEEKDGLRQPENEEYENDYKIEESSCSSDKTVKSME